MSFEEGRRPIPQPLVNKICDGADISLVINLKQELRHLGKNLEGLCPFCGARDFTVSELKNFYHCFNCKKSGTALTYLIEACDMQLVEAVELLGKMQGIDIWE